MPKASVASDLDAGAGAAPEPRRPRVAGSSSVAVAILVVAGACGGAAAGVHPTGTAVVDQLYGALAAGIVTLAATRASRVPILFLASVALAFSRGSLWLPAGASLILAFGMCVARTRRPLLCGFAGALASQVLLRWPPVGFHGSTAIVALVAVLPVLLSGWHRSGRRAQRAWAIGTGSAVAVVVVASVPVALSALSAQHHLEQGITLAKSSVNAVETGQSSQANDVVGQAAADLATAHHRLSAWWNVGGYVVPGLAQQERALDTGASAGVQLSSAVATQSAAFKLSDLHFHDGRIDVASLEAMQRPTELVDQAATNAQHQIAHIRSGWLLHSISTRLESFDRPMDRFRSDANLAMTAAKDGPALLGADGTRHYLVAFMTPAETRGLGGFLGAYGILTVDDGTIKLTASGRPIQLTAAHPATLRMMGPASYIARYGQFDPRRNFEDLTYAPDMATVGQVMSQMYPQMSGGSSIDGVLVMDPDALAALLKITGPVTVPGLGQLTAANAAPVLLRWQYLIQSVSNDQRHDFLQAALTAGFDRLTSEALPSLQTIGSILVPMVKQGRLLFWSSHSSDDSLIARMGLAGVFPTRGDGDLLAITDANAANNKLDAYVHQSVTDQVDYNPTSGRVASTVNVDLQNAGTTALPSYVASSYDGSGLPYGTDQTWLSIYSPLSLKSVTVGGRPVAFSGPTEEDGVYAYSGWVAVGPQSTTRVVAKFTGKIAPGGYTITTRLQPLANAQSFTVSTARGSWTAGTDEVQRHSWPLHS